MQEKIILGIDPGTLLLGYGLIRQNGKRFSYVEMGVADLRKIKDPSLKLKIIFEKIAEIIDQYHPDEMAIEAPFYGVNAQSLLKLGRAQGVCIACAMSREVPVFEYAPLRIKQSITGKGSASKEQVQAMLFRLMTINDKPKYLDASDALAVAVCHVLQEGKPQGGAKGGNTWASFVSKHTDRIL